MGCFMSNKTIKAYVVVRSKDLTILDDGIDIGKYMVVVYPVFRDKSGAILYRKQNYGNSKGYKVVSIKLSV